jgi:hypothetical protein
MRSFLLPKVLQYYVQDYVDPALKYKLMISGLKREQKKYLAFFEHIPDDVVVKLFVNGLYDKLRGCIRPAPDRTYVVGNHGRGKRTSCTTIADSSLTTHLSLLLDTIYYGFSLSPNATERPTYHFSQISDGSLSPVFIPTPGHDTLTKHINPSDLLLFVINLSCLGNKFNKPLSGPKLTASMSFIQARDKIIYEFLVLVQHIGFKYRNKFDANQKIVAKQLATKQLEVAQRKANHLAAANAKKLEIAERKANKLAAAENKRIAADAKKLEIAQRKANKLAAAENKRIAADAKKHEIAQRKTNKLTISYITNC